jgi:D-ribose pyranose/furanose isomerase RbsD
VVVRILIVLSINNWNEARKATIFEDKILNLIDQNLEIDSISISKELYKTKQAIELKDRLLQKVSQKEYGNSLNNWVGKIISFERFKSQFSAFEVLKSRGIEAISNKELQIKLISYDDESLYKLYESLGDVNVSFRADWVPVIKTDFSDFKWKE